MSTHGFTPGPWKAFFGIENNKVLIGIGEETGEGVTDCGFGLWRGKDEEASANAHLIAAAPELYEALEQAAHQIALIGTPDDPINNAILDMCNAALARARGEHD